MAKKAFLKALKNKINTTADFSCVYPRDKFIECYIWVKTKDNMIGDTECHYEVIFHEDKHGPHGVASVEVHFEDDNFRNFQNIQLPNGLKYERWFKEKDSRIVYDDTINASKGKNPPEKTKKGEKSCEEIIDRLRNMEEHIGKKLRKAKSK